MTSEWLGIEGLVSYIFGFVLEWEGESEGVKENDGNLGLNQSLMST